MTMAANGLPRKRQRKEDGAVEKHEPARLSYRWSGKRKRDREANRDREKEGDRLSRSSKRKGDRMMHSSNEEDSSDESVRTLPLNSSSLNHRKSFPPPAARVFIAAPPCKTADEIFGVSVPRKRRSASMRRSHECRASSGALKGEQIHRRAWTSSASPSSSTVSTKKIKPDGPMHRPPKSSSKSSSSQEKAEIEIAGVLYGMRKPEGPSNDSVKFDSRETNKPSSKAPKRKRPRPVKNKGENPVASAIRRSPISLKAKAESDQPSKSGIASPNLDKNSRSIAENSCISHELANSQATLTSSKTRAEIIDLESEPFSDANLSTEESEREDVGLRKEDDTEEPPRSPRKESLVLKLHENDLGDVKTTVNSTIFGSGKQRKEKLQIDLMAPPPSMGSSPERDVENSFVAGDPKPKVVEAETEVRLTRKEDTKSPKLPPNLLFNHPHLKRCATHCSIARSIFYHQQIARMNLSAEFHGNVLSRARNTAPDNGHDLLISPDHVGKGKGSQAANIDSAPGKQIMTQQALPLKAPNNLQQEAASSSQPVSTYGTGDATSPTMNFRYPELPSNEAQYLALLQNNAYPYAIPSYAGALPAYHGTYAQALPFFTGPFLSSQMFHPSQLQGHQNPSMSSGCSSFQKLLQNQQGKAHASGSNGGGGSLRGLPASRNQTSQALQNHPIMLNHHNLQMMAMSHAAQQKNHGISGEGKAGCVPSYSEEDRKAISRKLMLDHLGYASSQFPTSLMPSAINTNVPSAQKQQQIIQLQKQHQLAAASTSTARGMTPSSSNHSVYLDHHQFLNAVSAIPQNLVQKTTTSQSPPPSLASTTSQISYAATNSLSPFALVMVGSPTTSSMSESAGSSGSKKVGQASSSSSQQAKNSRVGRNVPTIFSGSQQIPKQLSQHDQVFYLNPYRYLQASQSGSSTMSTSSAARGHHLERQNMI